MARALEYMRPIYATFVSLKIKQEPNVPEICNEEPTDSETNKIDEIAPTTNTIDANQRKRKKSKYEEIKDKAICTICMAHFKNDFSLQAHTRVWSGKYKCDQCNATFCTLCGLQIHQRRGCDIKSNAPCNFLFCNFCNAELKWKTSLQSHLFHVHGDLIHSGKNGDEDASVRSNGLINFNDTPLAEELAPPSKRRKICQSMEYSSPLDFEVSNSPSTDTLKDKLEKCKECVVLIKQCDSIVKSIKLGENTSLQVDSKETVHLLNNVNSASSDLPVAKCVNVYKCSRCEKSFPLEEMKKHMIAVHLTSNNYTARYKSKKMLPQHYTSHNSTSFKDNVQKFNIMKKLHHCPGCRKQFWLRSCLQQHEKVCRRRIAQRSPASDLESSKDGTAQAFDENPDSSKLSEDTVKRSRSAKIQCTENMKKLLASRVMKSKVERPHCSVCGQFKSLNRKCMHKTLVKHFKIWCDICHQAFASTKMLESHMSTVHKYNTLDKYFSKNSNQEDVKVQHVDANATSATNDLNVNVICNVCNLAFQSYDRFRDHNKYYYQDQALECSVCGKSFHGMYQLHHHNKLEHYPSKLRDLYTYKCNICEEGFNYKSHLHAHKFHVHPDGMMVDINIRHDHTYALPTNVITTSENVPSIPMKTYMCDVCNLQFTNKEDLEKHQMEYSNNGEIYCKRCTKSYNTIAALAKHYSLNHSGSVPNIMKCCHCNEALTTNTSLQCHVKHFHGSNASQNVEKKRKRNSCMKFNGGLVEFDEHVGDTCAICSTKFDSTVSLKNHLLEYSNIGSYECIICRRKFTELRFLEEHKMNHVDSRATLDHCPICNEGFTDSAVVRIHMLHLHPYENFGLIQNADKTSLELCGAPESIDPKDNIVSLVSDSSDVNENVLKCPKCDLEFNGGKNITEHSSCYECEGCSYRFSSLSLKNHELGLAKYDHLSKFKCPHCMKTYHSLVTLYSHLIQSHGNEEKLSFEVIERESDVSKECRDLIVF